MNEEIIYLGCVLSMAIPFAFILMFAFKYYYISTICRHWNEKLYNYTKHIEKKENWKRENYKYLNDLYLYPDEVRIYLFKNWKEENLILDKFILFNVNEYYRKKKKSRP